MTAGRPLDVLLAEITARLGGAPARTMVGVDGVDCAGKTTFADALASWVRARGREVVRISVDDFHHPRAVRYRRGRLSANGFYEDAFDYGRLIGYALEPLRAGGSGTYRVAAHDLATDEPRNPEPRQAADDALVVVDGLFLQRPELRAFWDVSVFLDVPFEVSVRRMAARDGTPDDVTDPVVRRYVDAQERYFAENAPRSRATFVVDNTVPAEPRW